METVALLDHRAEPVARRIREVQRAAYRVEADLIGYALMPPLVEQISDIVQLNLTMLGASDGGALVGVLGYRRTGEVVDLDRVAVRPTRFRRGTGRRLIEALHEREFDAERFEVSTGADNLPAISLYRAMGYRANGEAVASGVRIAHFVLPTNSR